MHICTSAHTTMPMASGAIDPLLCSVCHLVKNIIGYNSPLYLYVSVHLLTM
uniref:Uncharacterized protein n=1 Tax=Anguilla anguilla TaxID=7936 RepID=A0A0E9SK73_ANGAN